MNSFGLFQFTFFISLENRAEKVQIYSFPNLEIVIFYLFSDSSIILKMKLCYWKCRGLAHPIRLLLEYCEEECEYATLECGKAPFFDKKNWYENKYDIMENFDFPNLPYFEDGDVYLTHHVAIIQYLGRKYGLSPITDIEHQNVDMIREQAGDLKNNLISVMYFFEHRKNGQEPTQSEIVQKKQNIAPLLKFNISDIGRKYKKQKAKDEKAIWMAGRRLTYIDFLLYEQVDYARNLFPTLLEADEYCSAMKEFMLSFEQLPTIKKYMTSGKFEKFPFYGKRSYLGSSLETCYQDIPCTFERKSFF